MPRPTGSGSGMPRPTGSGSGKNIYTHKRIDLPNGSCVQCLDLPVPVVACRKSLYCNCPIDFLQKLDNVPYKKSKILYYRDIPEYFTLDVNCMYDTKKRKFVHFKKA